MKASVFDADPAERLARARILRSQGQLDQAEAMLLAERGGDAVEQSAVLGLLGRISLDRGDLSKARERLEAAFAAGQAAQLYEQAIDDALALAYLLSELRHDFEAAAHVLDEAEALAPRVPASRARLSYQRGLLAFNTGEVGAALGLFRHAVNEGATDPRTLLFAREMEAFTLGSLGRFDAALASLAALELPRESTVCELADRAANRGFVAFLSHEAERGRAPSKGALLHEMRIQFERAREKSERCGDPQRRKNAQINLGLAALSEGDPSGARKHLQAARLLTVEDRKLLAWELELAGRVALAESDFSLAEDSFRRSVNLAQAAFDLAWSYRAYWGLGQALRGEGDLEAATQSFAQAEQSLNQLLQSHAPLSLDQSAFLASRDGAVRGWLEVLLARSKVTEAHALARRAIARAQRQVARPGSSGALSVEARQRIRQELSTYRALRAELDAEAKDDWRKSARALAEATSERKLLQERALQALDRAYAFEPTREEQPFLPPPPGVLELTYFPLEREWLVFAATSLGVKAALVSVADPAQPSDRLFTPFAELIRSHAQLAIRTYGAASNVDFHALWFEGRPLIDGRVVVYPLDGATPPASVGPHAALVLVDPSASLSDSEGERQTVSQVLGARGEVRTLPEATRAGLLWELERSSFFHFGGHALATPYDPVSSRLLLGGGQALSVADILSLLRAPSEVVLVACESGKPSTSDGPPGLSLAAAFLARGSKQVIATTRPVSNRAAHAFVQALYAGYGQGLTLPQAFSRAQQTLLHEAPELDTRAFRLWTNSTEHSHDTQTYCDLCMAKRQSALERGRLRPPRRGTSAE